MRKMSCIITSLFVCCLKSLILIRDRTDVEPKSNILHVKDYDSCNFMKIKRLPCFSTLFVWRNGTIEEYLPTLRRIVSDTPPHRNPHGCCFHVLYTSLNIPLLQSARECWAISVRRFESVLVAGYTCIVAWELFLHLFSKGNPLSKSSIV